MFYDDTEFDGFDSAERNARKAHELYEDGKILQALDELNTAIEINPANSAWHFNKALALDTANKFDEAVEEYQTALQLNPNDLETLNSLAVDYTRIGHYDLGIKTFEYIEEIEPKFEPSYCNRIITYTEMGKHDMAEQMFYLAQQIEPDCPLCFYNIGNSLFVRGQYKKAIHCWLKTAELEPTHPQINYRIAQACWSDGNNEKARVHFLAELRKNPADIEVIHDFGLFLLHCGDIDAAKEKFNRILEFEPDFAPALLYLGEIAFKYEDYENAKELFNHALIKDCMLPGPRYRLAQYALMNGHEEKAKAYLVSELELASEDADVYVSIGSMLLKLGELNLAAHALLKALEFDYAHADAYYYLGIAHMLKEINDEAAEFFANALDINPRHIPALRDSAILNIAAGKVELAEEKIKKAISLSGDDTQLKAVHRQVRRAKTTGRITELFAMLKPNFGKEKL
ncbi:MAG: tetratricopeptide repeat protein [Candidatus Brocadiia bacterium]|nr:MAG: tetratricopeptide repeat protein [Candidatus Brocadiia bacterium]